MNQKNDIRQKPRRISFLLTQDLQSPSGVGRYLPWAKNLVKLGFSVDIIALYSNFSSLIEKTISIDGVNVFYVSQMHILKEANQTHYFSGTRLLFIGLLATWKLLVMTVKQSPDFIIIGKPHPMNSIAGVIASLLTGAKTILDCDDYEIASNYFSSSFQRKVVGFFENTVPKVVHQVTTNTFFNLKRMTDLGINRKKIHYIPNGVDEQRFSAVDEKKSLAIRKSLGLDGKRVIAYIGSLNLVNHPVNLLLEAFKDVVEIEPNSHLLVVGGGKDLEVLKDHAMTLGISDSVLFVGRIHPELVAHYYDIAEVTVDPVYDNDAAKGRCPLKMFESWAMGIPFVTSDVGDRAALAGDPPAALLCKPGEPQELSISIIKLLTDPELYNKIRSYIEHAASEFNWPHIASKSVKHF